MIPSLKRCCRFTARANVANVMKVSSFRQTACSLDQIDACNIQVSLIADENQYVKDGVVVLHRNGFQKRLPTSVLRLPRVSAGLRSSYVGCQEDGKSCQKVNGRSQSKNLVPLSCETVTESEEMLMGTKTCDNNVAIYTSSSFPQSNCQQHFESPNVTRHRSSDNPEPAVSGKQQYKYASHGSCSTLSSASDICSASVQCKWYKCNCEIASDMLLEHIRIKHVATQLHFSDDKVNAEEQSFVCLWNGCKVYNRPSCLLTWLERHIVSHLGDKPYCCIVAGCGSRFASQVMLERHVNGHFSGTCTTSLTVSRSLRKADSVIKLTRKRKPRSARPYPGYYALPILCYLLPLPKKEVMFLVRSVCLSVCLSVCPSDCSQTCERILTKFFVGVGHGSRTK